MNQTERELVNYLTTVKDRKVGFMQLRTDVDGWCADISLDASYDPFTSKCIFDDCNDAQAKTLLTAFLTHRLSVSPSVSEQLSKLLSTRGRLVADVIDPLLKTLNWGTCSNHLLFLSYLALSQDGSELAQHLLDVVPEDGRDGLFLACYILHSEPLDRKLIEKFVEWDSESWDPGSTGELYALEQFIAKWLALYAYSDLERVIRIYFKHRFKYR
jgi:hypothetical protein